MDSKHAFIAMSSDENVLPSTVFWRLLNQITGALFTKMMNPV